MNFRIVYVFFLLIRDTRSVQLLFIRNVILNQFNENNLQTMQLNMTCDQCLCQFYTGGVNRSSMALNCFANNSCQFFSRFPLTYTLQPMNQTRLYFLQNIYPNASTCCMPNITDLLTRLKNIIPLVVNLSFVPAALSNNATNPNEIALIGRYSSWVYWFNASNLNYLRNNSNINSTLTFAIHDNLIYAAVDNIPQVTVYNSQTSSPMFTVNSPTLNGIRKIIFLNNGQNMAVTSQGNQSVVIFNVNSPTNYTLQQTLFFPYPTIQGLVQVNSSLLYASSYDSRSIVAYKYQNFSWTSKTLVSNVLDVYGCHLAVDDCGRIWFILTNFGLRIYDSSGVELGNWTINANMTFDLLLLPNYVFILSIREPPQIIRYDPQVICP